MPGLEKILSGIKTYEQTVKAKMVASFLQIREKPEVQYAD